MVNAFSELDWTSFDVWAVVTNRGIAVVDASHIQSYRAWLQRHEYTVISLDFGNGISPVVGALGRLLRWEEQFGYVLAPDNRNLDALRDGFEFPLKPGNGLVLEFLGADVAHLENSRWLSGLLYISSEYSHEMLALGARFFTTLILNSGSKLIGRVYESLSVPGPFWKEGRVNPFDDKTKDEATS